MPKKPELLLAPQLTSRSCVPRVPAKLTSTPASQMLMRAEVVDDAAPRFAVWPGNGIVSFAVHLGLGQTELPVLVGMTANANLVTANRDNVLLVPNSAIRLDRDTGVYSVNQVTGRDETGGVVVTAVNVTIGLSDNQYTQISSGLNEGDEVVLGVLTASDNGFNGPPGPGLRR